MLSCIRKYFDAKIRVGLWFFLFPQHIENKYNFKHAFSYISDYYSDFSLLLESWVFLWPYIMAWWSYIWLRNNQVSAKLKTYYTFPPNRNNLSLWPHSWFSDKEATTTCYYAPLKLNSNFQGFQSCVLTVRKRVFKVNFTLLTHASCSLSAWESLLINKP